MVSSFPQKSSKRTGVSSFGKCLHNSAVGPSLPGGLLLQKLYIMISSKDISASQVLKCSLDIFFLLGIF